jgi:alpha-1,2-mannosyltransferase
VPNLTANLQILKWLLMSFSFLKDADWFGSDRALGYSRAIVLLYVPFLLYYYWAIAFGPHGCDFAAFWAAGRVAWHDAALAYDQRSIQALQSWIEPSRWLPFNNPPPFLFVVAPFGLLPVKLAQPLWVIATLSLYILACRGLIGLWPSLAFTPVFANCATGQNGLLTGALFIGAISQLERRPFVSGLFFGSLVIKPQLALLIPIALLAGRQWRAFVGAAVSSLGLLVLSYVVFGPRVFPSFLLGTTVSKAILVSGVHALKQPTLFEPALALGANLTLATAIQALLTLLIAGVVGWAWRRDGTLVEKGAILATATALTS